MSYREDSKTCPEISGKNAFSDAAPRRAAPRRAAPPQILNKRRTE
jgi:hypothetical protein